MKVAIVYRGGQEIIKGDIKLKHSRALLHSLHAQRPNLLPTAWSTTTAGARRHAVTAASVVRTNPVAKTSVGSGLFPVGLRQTTRARASTSRSLRGGLLVLDMALHYPACLPGHRDHRSRQRINRSRIVPEYSFLDARGLGAFEWKSLETLLKDVDTLWYFLTIERNFVPKICYCFWWGLQNLSISLPA
ncbi:hypothetical protein GUJ93_ZPchr0013g35895 [Zizania palustris]|uniref:Uncharacterized protein n=1 Tax=Zizania palustris TaxID=103762 RepID=A0A8J5WUF1_ZIZPA|nr:hypothetical protein GUJ93_ZPchr0013g35895 [Zizania palustris]